ncbi:hypothetical protein ACHAWF_012943 [Thalassiosira exigua]
MMNVYHASFHVALVALAFFNALVVAEGRNLLRDSWGLSIGNGNGKNDGDERLLKASGNKIDGSYIVVFEEWVPENSLKDMAREALLETGGILKENGIVEIIHGFVADMTEEEAPALAKLPWIKFSPPNTHVNHIAKVRIADLTWGLDRIDQRSLPLDGVWNSNFPSGGDGAVVYVIDILSTHKQFGNRAYAHEDYDFVTEDLRSGQDCHGHGTHCAGTVGSTAFGVAEGDSQPFTQLVSVRVLGCSGSGRWSRLVQGLNKVGTDCPRGVNQAGRIHNGKRCVVSMSLGGPGTQTTVRDAVKNLKDKDVVVVAAAGNANDNACSFAPANVEEAFTVGATDSTDHRSSFSNYGTGTSAWSTSDPSKRFPAPQWLPTRKKDNKKKNKEKNEKNKEEKEEKTNDKKKEKKVKKNLFKL